MSNQFEQALQKVVNDIQDNVRTTLLRASIPASLNLNNQKLNQLLFLIDQSIIDTHKSSKKSYNKKVKSILTKFEKTKMSTTVQDKVK